MGFRDLVKKERSGKVGFQLPEGTYVCKFKDFERSKTFNSGDPMWVLKFKIVSIQDLKDAKLDNDVVLQQIVDKKKQVIEIKCLDRLSFHFTKVLDFIDGSGYDLDLIDEENPEPGIEKALAAIEDNPPKVVMYGSRGNDDNSKYLNWSFNHIENKIGQNKVEIEGVEYVWNDLLEQGWSVEDIENAINPKQEK